LDRSILKGAVDGSHARDLAQPLAAADEVVIVQALSGA